MTRFEHRPRPPRPDRLRCAAPAARHRRRCCCEELPGVRHASSPTCAPCTHVACQLVAWVEQPPSRSCAFDRHAVLFGAAVHDIGKVLHPDELSGSGLGSRASRLRAAARPRGRGPGLARFARTHASWTADGVGARRPAGQPRRQDVEGQTRPGPGAARDRTARRRARAWSRGRRSWRWTTSSTGSRRAPTTGWRSSRATRSRCDRAAEPASCARGPSASGSSGRPRLSRQPHRRSGPPISSVRATGPPAARPSRPCGPWRVHGQERRPRPVSVPRPVRGWLAVTAATARAVQV